MQEKKEKITVGEKDLKVYYGLKDNQTNAESRDGKFSNR